MGHESMYRIELVDLGLELVQELTSMSADLHTRSRS
jgi:hypothetical protein